MSFDFKTGPGELKDISADDPDRVRALSEEMVEALRKNRAFSLRLHGGQPNETISPQDLPPTERKLLEELGYLESEADAG
jgi:hypothetical protein